MFKNLLVVAGLLISSLAHGQTLAQFSFENDVQRWSGSNSVTSLTLSTTQKVDGTKALAAKFDMQTPKVMELFAGIQSQTFSDSKITFNVYLPSTAKVSLISPYALTKNPLDIFYKDATPKTGWNSIVVDVPSGADPVIEIGIELTFTAKFTGTIYVDAVKVVKNSPPPVADSGTPPPVDSGTPPVVDSGTPVVDSGTPPVVDSGSSGSMNYVIPPDRAVLWNPGLNSVGGIPNRTTICQTLSPSGGDDTSVIQTALNNCPANQVVKLNAGTFNISGMGLEMTRSNVVLRGSGPTSTFLNKTDTTSFSVISMGRRWSADKYWSSNRLSADALRGASSVTFTSVPALPFAVGDTVRIDQLTDPSVTVWSSRSPAGDVSRGWFSRYDRPLSQIVEVTAVAGNTITFMPPLHSDFKVAFQAEVARFGDTWRPAPNPTIKYVGVEDLAVSGGQGGDQGGNIHLWTLSYSWVKNIVSSRSSGTAVALDGCFRCEVRDSYIHSSVDPNPGGAGYLLGLNWAASDNLIENNVVWSGNKVIVMRASGGGNVVGYNYMQDAFGAGYPTWVENGLNASHMTTGHHELFEGNESFSFSGDNVWGNAVYITALRNNLTGLRRSAAPLALSDLGNRTAINLPNGHYWYTLVGNVLGFRNMPLLSGQTSFVYESTNYSSNAIVPMYKLGQPESGSTPDAKVAQTLIRQGNYDYVTNTVKYDDAAKLVLPASLYLNSKPAFFGSNPWPWVNPDASTDAERVMVLPAKVRFDSLHP